MFGRSCISLSVFQLKFHRFLGFHKFHVLSLSFSKLVGTELIGNDIIVFPSIAHVSKCKWNNCNGSVKNVLKAVRTNWSIFRKPRSDLSVKFV